MLPATNLLGLQCAVQYYLISGNWHANNCLSINESFRVKCEEFQYLVNKIGLLPSASVYILQYVGDEQSLYEYTLLWQEVRRNTEKRPLG